MTINAAKREPWHVDDHGHIREGTRLVAAIYDRSATHQIVASSDLLSALEAIRECCFIDLTKELDTPCIDCIDMANAAIAKAKGELL